MECDLARYASVARQICVPGSDAEPLRNSLIRRGNSIRNRDWRYRVLLWIRRLKVRILPPQPQSRGCMRARDDQKCPQIGDIRGHVNPPKRTQPIAVAKAKAVFVETAEENSTVTTIPSAVFHANRSTGPLTVVRTTAYGDPLTVSMSIGPSPCDVFDCGPPRSIASTVSGADDGSYVSQTVA